jgi:hypothetical protein
VAGITPHSNAAWMTQVARTITMEAWGFLAPGHSLIHDRDEQDCPAFPRIIDTAEVTRVLLPVRSPHHTADAERWVRWITETCLSRWMLCGDASLRHALTL